MRIVPLSCPSPTRPPQGGREPYGAALTHIVCCGAWAYAGPNRRCRITSPRDTGFASDRLHRTFTSPDHPRGPGCCAADEQIAFAQGVTKRSTRSRVLRDRRDRHLLPTFKESCGPSASRRKLLPLVSTSAFLRQNPG